MDGSIWEDLAAEDHSKAMDMDLLDLLKEMFEVQAPGGVHDAARASSSARSKEAV